MRPPDFLGVGTMKSGTSWAWRQLAGHPGIAGPVLNGRRIKEVHFLDRFRLSLPDYLRAFAHSPTKRAGEFTPNYICAPHAPSIVQTHFPSARLFAIFRNPVERAFSHYKDHLCYGRIPPGTSFIDAFRSDHPRGEPPHYSVRNKGHYGDQVEAWRRHFDEGQFRVMFYDDLSVEPLRFLRDLYAWVGVDPDYVPPGHRDRVVKRYNLQYDGLQLAERDRAEVADYYRPQVRKLEELTGRRLGHWSSDT